MYLDVHYRQMLPGWRPYDFQDIASLRLCAAADRARHLEALAVALGGLVSDFVAAIPGPRSVHFALAGTRTLVLNERSGQHVAELFGDATFDPMVCRLATAPGAGLAGTRLNTNKGIFMNRSIILQQPQSQASELVLLFHGVGATPADMAAVGRRAALTLPDAMVVSVAAPFISDFGHGLQWFSVQGVTEENRKQRIAQACHVFVETIQSWQRATHIDAALTTLIGFSQGGIMSLAATQLDTPPAHRVLAIAGRFASQIAKPSTEVQIHLFHGENDMLMPMQHSQQAASHLDALDSSVTLDTFAGLGHAMDERVLSRLSERLLEKHRAER